MMYSRTLRTQRLCVECRLRVLVLDEQGRHVEPLEWKDTVNVPLKQTVKLVVRYDDRPGSWMFHCHILDHADGGLIGMVDLGVPHVEHGH